MRLAKRDIALGQAIITGVPLFLAWLGGNLGAWLVMVWFILLAVIGVGWVVRRLITFFFERSAMQLSSSWMDWPVRVLSILAAVLILYEQIRNAVDGFALPAAIEVVACVLCCVGCMMGCSEASS